MKSRFAWNGRLPDVAHVVWEGEVGGIERVVSDLARSQRESAARRVGVLFARPGGPFHDSLAAESDVEVCAAGFRTSVDLRAAAIRRAARFLESFDVIHVHVYNPVTMSAAWASRRPMICTLHGIPRSTWAWRRWAALPVRRCFIRSAACITANSAFCRDTDARWLGLKASDVEVIWNGVPAPVRTGITVPGVEELRAEGARLVAGFLGRFVEFKRVDRVVEAVRDLPVSLGVALALAGDGELSEALRLAASDHANSSRIAFLGTVARVGDFLAGVDLLVVPSRGEPYGLVIAEAALCGTPVVVFADGGGAIEIAATTNGTVLQSVAELRDLLVSWAEDGVPATAQPDMDAIGRAVSMKTMARRFDRVYLRALEVSRKHR